MPNPPPTRALIAYLADLTYEAAIVRPNCIHTQLQASCCYCLASLYHKLDLLGRWLNDDEIADLRETGHRCLLLFQALSDRALIASLPEWNLTPKAHYLMHLLDELPRVRQNPRYYHCFSDEDYVGYVSRVGRPNQRCVVIDRVMETVTTDMILGWL